jgi:hypothetical protein
LILSGNSLLVLKKMLFFYCFLFHRSAQQQKKPRSDMMRCANCKTKRYQSVEEQKQDWPRHKLECKKLSVVTNQMDLAAMWSAGVLHMCGPFLNPISQKWDIGTSEISASVCAAEVMLQPAPARLPYDVRLTPRAYAEIHALYQIPNPVEMFCVYTRVFEPEELLEHDTKNLALPDGANMPLSRTDFWSWFMSGKCDLFTSALMLALQATQRVCEVEYLVDSQPILEFGTVNVLYMRPFVPVCRTFQWHAFDKNSVPSPQDVDLLADACYHRILYFKKSDNTTTYVDFSAAQYHAGTSMHEAATCVPVLVSHSEAELKQNGFVIDATIARLDNSAYGEWKLLNGLLTSTKQTRERTFALARQILEKLAPFGAAHRGMLTQSQKQALQKALPLLHTPAWELLFAPKNEAKPGKTLAEKWHCAKEVFEKSQTDTKLKSEILMQIPDAKLYDLWFELDIAKVIANYQTLNLQFKVSFLVMLWFSEKDTNIQQGVACPRILSCQHPIQRFDECVTLQVRTE